MRNRVFKDNEILREAQNRLNEWLPDSWKLKEREWRPERGAVADQLIDITAPDGSWAQLVVEAKKTLDPKDVETVINRIRRCSEPSALPMIEAPFLSDRTRERLRDLGAGFIDLTGNAYLRLERPAVLIERSGASRDPWRLERPVRSLKGPKAARLVRALIDFTPPRGIREIAAIADIDAGYASRLLAFLEKEDLISRKKRGPIEAVDWPELLRMWVRDYSLTKSNNAYSYLQPRGLSSFVDQLRSIPAATNERYALTGSLAAARLAPVAPAALGTCYTENVSGLADRLNLLPAESGANVLLLDPFDPVVFERSKQSNGLTYVAPSQAAADLLTGSGRMPEEGEVLLSWMKANEAVWRAK